MNTNKKHFGLRTLMITVAIAVLLLGGISITGAAAQSAIPGDALYPVKTTIEQTRLSMARDAGDRAQLKMGNAELRLEEIRALIEEGRYREVGAAVLAFEADINSAILELETVAKADPARAGSLAMEITASLTRYAQTLSALSAAAPDAVRAEVTRALDSTHLAGSLDMPSGDDNANDNGDDNSNDHANDNGDDNANDNGNDNADDHGGDNSNDNGDDNSNGNDNANDNGNDDNGNVNANENGDDHGGDNANVNDNSNENGDDNGGDTGNANANDNANDNGDDHGGNSGSSDDSSNDNADDHGGNRGKGGGDDSGGKDDGGY